ncbi:MAG: hypothetical protein WBQ26_10270 [Gemmatimonadaceae bacterium]|nr:hypothetical protein [Gemmatimonadaceae bacterium]
MRAATPAETAIYRLVAESVYVRTTARSVGIVTASLDTACMSQPCHPLLSRWGLDPLWWADGDSASALATRADLMARTASPLTLAAVPDGQRLLQAVAPDSAAVVVAQPDTARWKAFKEHHGGASGFLWFSPVGFDARRQSAVVFVDWRCGPLCGHTVTIALHATADGAWRIADMLLVSSRSARPDTGPR